MREVSGERRERSERSERTARESGERSERIAVSVANELGGGERERSVRSSERIA